MTEEELVEKVARAIIGPYTKPHESPLTWEHCKAQARAAIAAMREAGWEWVPKGEKWPDAVENYK